MMHTVLSRTYAPPPVCTKEIWRYAGMPGEDPALAGLLRDCLDEIVGKLTYKVCWREFPVVCCGDGLDLGFMKASSRALKKNLTGCGSLILFAATVGIEPDRLIARYSRLSPTRALLFQAIGAERIESLCDAFCRDMAQQQAAAGRSTRPRFSPGYGDFPLGAQTELFRVLDCPRKIGLTLNESLLMSPSKSVTALIGVTGEWEDNRPASPCKGCAKQDCVYRSIE